MAMDELKYVDESSYKYNDKGELIFAYMKDEIAGFAIHFNQK